MRPLALSLIAKRAELLGWGHNQAGANSSDTEVVMCMIENQIQELRANPSPVGAWQFLQVVFGSLPSHNLLKGFLRRITVFSPDAIFSWLVEMLAAIATPPLLGRSSIVVDEVSIEGSSSWINDSAALIRQGTEGREALLLAQPKVFLGSLNLSARQSSALCAFSLLPQQEVWLMADELFLAGNHAWPTQGESAYQRFMQWRVVSIAKGMIGHDQQAFESFQRVRRLYQSQGVEPLIEQLRSTPIASLAPGTNV